VTSKQPSFDIDIDIRDLGSDDLSKTLPFVRAITLADLQRTDCAEPRDMQTADHDGVRRLLIDVARPADEAARQALRRRVVALLLMLFALALLVAAGWSC